MTDMYRPIVVKANSDPKRQKQVVLPHPTFINHDDGIHFIADVRNCALFDCHREWNEASQCILARDQFRSRKRHQQNG